jgi:histidine triad (HIT) family protein
MATVFSKIISGQIPSFKVHEDQWTFAFLTKDAIQLGHTLIVPKVEVDYFIDVPEPYYSKVFENARLISRAIHNVTKCKRVGTIIAGWDVPHFHYHLVPMFDYFDLDPKLAQERDREENLKMQSALQEEIDRQLRIKG